MRDTFVKTLINLAKENKDIELITGDLGFGVLKPYWEQLPEQFTNAGIAEQNMTSMAAGMALSGKTVFTYSIGNFPTLRCLEQIRNDCAYHNANVKIVCVGGGFAYGALGMSHQATEDIAVMRALPNVSVICPGDLEEAAEAVKAIIDKPGTCYLRLGRGGEQKIHKKIENFQIGKSILVRKFAGKGKIAVFSTGAILEEVYLACGKLGEMGYGIEQYSFHTVKPLDISVVQECAKKCDYIITVEEHNIVGGLGGAVAEIMAESSQNVKLVRMGLNDQYGTVVGSQQYLREEYGISAKAIVERVRRIKERGE